jgi:nucleoside-diphosphate-sugar epimerase
MKFLILGASSFLARQFCSDLKSLGHTVYESSRSGTPIKLDIFDSSKISEHLANLKPNFIVNFAWNTQHDSYSTNPINSQYTKSSIEIFRISQEFRSMRYIGIGSGAEYGENGLFSAGISISNPKTEYAKAKAKTFERLKEESNNGRFEFQWARVFQPYGPKQDSKRFIPSILACIRENSIFVLQNPFYEADWIHTHDISTGLIAGIENGFQEFDLGTSETISNLTICQYLSQKFGLKFKISDSSDLTQNRYGVAKTSPLLKETSWRPSRKLLVELDKMIQ